MNRQIDRSVYQLLNRQIDRERERESEIDGQTNKS